MNIAVLGSGNVGGAIARALTRKEVGVCIALVDGRTDLVPDWIQERKLEVKPISEAVESADALILAVPFSAVESLLPKIGHLLRNKILIDCTNPVAPDLSHGLASQCSGSELIQTLVTEAYVVKCFSIYGYENLEYPPLGPTKPAMLIAGDKLEAVDLASQVAELIGWEPVHVGSLDQALHLEHMTLLWIKMIRTRGMNPRTVWARMQGEL